jgi:hypothetical protein
MFVATLAVLAGSSVTLAQYSQANANVVISQVYGGGGNSQAPLNQDFIELYNRSGTPQTMNGWSIQFASAATGTFSKFNLPTVTLNPNQFYLITCGTPGANGSALPTADANAATFTTVGARGGRFALVRNTTALVQATDFTGSAPNASTAIEDFVGFGSSSSGAAAINYEGSARVPDGIGNTTAAVRNNHGCDDSGDNSLDFQVIAPNPHNSSTTLPCGAAFPDLALQLSNSGCNPTVGSNYDVTAQLSNLQALATANTVVTVVLPPTLTYTGSVPSTGTTSYDAPSRTVTWTVGTFPANGSASMTVSSTVASAGGLYVTGAATTTTANDPPLNNLASNANDVTATGAALSAILVTSGGTNGDPTLATNIDEGGFPRQLATIYRTFTSADGNWIVFRTDMTTGGSDGNGAVVVGHNTGSGWTFSFVAHEGPTGSAPVASLPNSKIDSNTFGNIQGINNAGEYVYTCRVRDQAGTPTDNTDDVLNWVLVKGTVAGGVSMTIKGGDTNHAGNAGADAATAPELAGRNYIVISSSTIQGDGTVSFASTLSGTTATGAAFLKNNGNTLLAQKGVTVPGNAGGLTMTFMDNDASSDGRGLMVSADGANWLGTGKVGIDTANDDVVVVSGSVAVREGSTVGSFTDPAGWATFGSQEVPWAQMLADGSWYVHGYNPATSGFNQGQDWVERSGTFLANTGSPIIPGSTEVWADNILQRTFFLEAGAGDAFVVGGLTNRSAAANGSDTATDGVVVYRGSSVLVREGAPVTVMSNDVPPVASTHYLNLINDNRSFVAGGKLYMTATLRNANSICSNSFAGIPQAIVAIDLPATNPCPADIGSQGGEHHSDGQLNNNDFIVFIDYFFAQNPIADVGAQGGEHHSDGQFNNNDFIVFIDLFFAGC